MQDSHYACNKKIYKEKAKKARLKRQKQWRDFKATLACEQCGENRPPTLDFHHSVGSKEFNISSAVLTYSISWDEAMAEVAKCIVLCANCHRVLHDKERNP